MLNHKTENHNNANNINMDPVEANTIIKKPKFVHLNVKTLSVCVVLNLCVLVFTTIFFAYKYYQCTSSDDNEALVEWADVLRGETSTPVPFARLPTSILPLMYTIKILPHIIEDNFTFSGEVRIQMKILSDTDNVTVHMNELDILQYSIISVNTSEEELKVEEVISIPSSQFLVFKVNHQLLADKQYELYIKYVGRLNNDMRGLYRSWYERDNIKRWIVASQFQPVDARRAFPCFDEPSLKAKFQITLGRTRNMTSLSNMNLKEHLEDGDYVWDVYRPSPLMSTYLVAMAVTDFSSQSSSTGSVHAWSRHELLDQTQYSLEIAPKLLSYFQQYFDYPYPLKKMDLIALPDFSAGAMENYGLITFRETSMLYDEQRSTNLQKERVATILSHELAHQWFGNLVTLSWWNDLWLNEGFASYVEYLGVDYVEPSWNITNVFVVDELQSVFFLDALKSSHPIQVEVNNLNQVSEMFNKISYSKGAALLRMVDHILTNQVLKDGLRTYVKEKAYLNATQAELWKFLSQAGHNSKSFPKDMHITSIMQAWTHQAGYPLITVTRNYEAGTAHVSQKRFLLEPLDTRPEKEPLWWVPLTFSTRSLPRFSETQPQHRHWLREEPSLTLNQEDLKAQQDDWLIFNNQETGYYRVQYDNRNWALITATLRDPAQYSNIHVLNRAQLVDDAMSLARGGLLDYQIALNVTSYMRHEKDLVPWRSLLSAFGFIEAQMYRKPDFEHYKKYILYLLEPLYGQLGFDQGKNDDQLTIYKRVEINTRACMLGHPACVAQALAKFQEWISHPPSDFEYIPVNLKSMILCTGVRMGSTRDWDILWEKYANTSIASEREIYLSALACSQEYSVLARYLDLALTEDSKIRKQDASRVFSAVSQSPIGHSVALDFLFNQWGRIRTYLNGTQMLDMAIIRFCTKRISSQSELKQLNNFVLENKHDLSSVRRTMLQIIENAETNVKWAEKNYQSIVNWLKNPHNYQHTRR